MTDCVKYVFAEKPRDRTAECQEGSQNHHADAKTDMNERTADTGREPLRILVVEDDPAARFAMQKLLELRGHRVASASSMREAAEVAEQLEPEVLISDWKLGDSQDGLDVAASLSERYDLAVIMITAHRLDRLQHKARDMHLDIAACRRKPVSVAELAELAESLKV